MNNALKIKTDKILAFRKKDIDLICDGIISCFDEGNEKETRDALENFFQILTPVESASLLNYLLRYTPINARTDLIALIKQEYLKALAPAKPQKTEILSISQLSQKDLDTIIAENIQKDQIIEALKKKIEALKNNMENIYKALEPHDNILKDLKDSHIRLWKNRLKNDPPNPLDYYRLHYQGFQGRMYQFILRKYDPALIKAMDGKIAYLRKKGENLQLHDYVPPKKEKTTRKTSVMAEKMPFLEK
jgi:hypothetical protein